MNVSQIVMLRDAYDASEASRRKAKEGQTQVHFSVAVSSRLRIAVLFAWPRSAKSEASLESLVRRANWVLWLRTAAFATSLVHVRRSYFSQESQFFFFQPLQTQGDWQAT